MIIERVYEKLTKREITKIVMNARTASGSSVSYALKDEKKTTNLIDNLCPLNQSLYFTLHVHFGVKVSISIIHNVNLTQINEASVSKQ